MLYLLVCTESILAMMTDAISSSCMKSRSTVGPPTRIQRVERSRTSGLSAQAIGHPHTSIPISHGVDDISVTSRKPGWSNFSISRTNPDRSIRGLQPPQYFMPISPMYETYRCSNRVSHFELTKRFSSQPGRDSLKRTWRHLGEGCGPDQSYYYWNIESLRFIDPSYKTRIGSSGVEIPGFTLPFHTTHLPRSNRPDCVVGYYE